MTPPPIQSRAPLNSAIKRWIVHAAGGRIPTLPVVFLSSATEGMAVVRLTIHNVLLEDGFVVRNFQTDQQADKRITDRLVDDIGAADVFLVLLGPSYGTVRESPPNISWTHFEWRTAREAKKPTLHALHDAHPVGQVAEDQVTCCERPQTAFIREIREGDNNFLRLYLKDPSSSANNIRIALIDHSVRRAPIVTIDTVASAVAGPPKATVIALASALVLCFGLAAAVSTWAAASSPLPNRWVLALAIAASFFATLSSLALAASTIAYLWFGGGSRGER